jgi:hypothetical protein
MPDVGKRAYADKGSQPYGAAIGAYSRELSHLQVVGPSHINLSYQAGLSQFL